MASRGLYRSIYSVLPDDPDFQRLTPHARLVLLIARLCEAAGPSAIFRYYLAVLMAQTGLAQKQVMAALEELRVGRWVEFDETVLWVRNGLRYEPSHSLANPKHRKGIETHLLGLPRSRVVVSFCEYYKMPIPFEWDSIPIRNREREREREPERETLPPYPPSHEEGGVWPSAQELAKLYNDRAPDECPAVTTDPLSPGRVKKAKAYLSAFPKREFWEQVFDQISASQFLRGLRPSNGHAHFVADFDWLLSKGKDGTENCMKVYDGKYHD